MESGTGKTVIIYKTKYGSTKRYAQWIAEGAGADVFDISGFDASLLDRYSTVVFGSYVHAGRIVGINFIKSHWDVLGKKKIVVFTSSGAPSDDPGQKKVFEASLPADIRSKTGYFPLQGAYDYGRMDLADKFIMQFPRLILQIRWGIGRDKKAKEFLGTFKVPRDHTSREAVEPIIASLNGK